MSKDHPRGWWARRQWSAPPPSRRSPPRSAQAQSSMRSILPPCPRPLGAVPDSYARPSQPCRQRLPSSRRQCTLAGRRPSHRTLAMTDGPFDDPLAWRPIKAPSLDELHVIAEEAYRRLPDKFRALCDGLVIHVEDFPTDEVLDELNAQTEFDLLGL